MNGPINGFNSLLSIFKQARTGGAEEQLQKKQAFVEELKSLPIAIETQVANEQHYEVIIHLFCAAFAKLLLAFRQKIHSRCYCKQCAFDISSFSWCCIGADRVLSAGVGQASEVQQLPLSIPVLYA